MDGIAVIFQFETAAGLVSGHPLHSVRDLRLYLIQVLLGNPSALTDDFAAVSHARRLKLLVRLSALESS